jgi:transcriptional regulator with XRE-family HTH domain
MSVGQRLKDARKARKLTQERLSKMTGVSQSTISDVERGRNASTKELPTLAAALGVSALWIATGRGPRHDSAPVRPLAPQRQINTELMVQAMRAVTAYQQQIGSRLDDERLLRLACRVYEQHIDTPDRTAAEMLGYLMSITDALGKTMGEP